MLDLVAECTVDFRPHVKTHKTIEGVLLQLGGVYHKIVTSTLSECYLYAKCNQVDDIIYGIPITPDKFPDCLSLHQQVQKFHIMIDNDWILEEIENFCSKNNTVFNVFILLDTGYARAGIVENEEGYDLVKRVNASKYTNFSGIYTHAGHSYGCTEKSNIIEVSDTEITVAIRFANYLKENVC
jgi:D-serine deaminase-like pyridoxal phosphate-dependent protein